MNLAQKEKVELQSLLKFILNEIWVDELDLTDFHSVVGIEKEEFLSIMDNYEFLKNEYLSNVNDLLVSVACGYPFHEKYEKKCDAIKDSCEFFLDKIQKKMC